MKHHTTRGLIAVIVGAAFAPAFMVPDEGQQGDHQQQQQGNTEKQQQQQSDDAGGISTQSTGTASAGTQMMQKLGFFPVTPEQVQKFEVDLLGILVAFAPNDHAKTIVTDVWKDARAAGVRDTYGGLGGVHLLSRLIYDGCNMGNWPWTLAADKQVQKQEQQQVQQHAAKTAAA